MQGDPKKEAERIRANVAAMQAQGASPEHIRAYLESVAQPVTEPSVSPSNTGKPLGLYQRLEGVRDAAISGATLGLYNRLESLVTGKEGRARQMEKERAFAEQYPKTDVAARLAGGLALPAGKAVGLLSKVGGGAFGGVATGGLFGGAAGAISGAANAPEGQAAEQAKHGGLLGFAFGALAPVVAAPASAVVNRVRGTPGPFAAAPKLGNTLASEREIAVKAANDAWAEQAYGAFREQNPTFDIGSFAEALKRPDLKRAWATIRTEGDLSDKSPGDQLMQVLFQGRPAQKGTSAIPAQVESEAEARWVAERIREMGGFTETMPDAGPRAVSFNDLQQLYRHLDGKVGEAFAKGKGELGKAYKELRTAVDQSIEAAVPGFQNVNANYSARQRVLESIEAGTKAASTPDAREVAADLARRKSEIDKLKGLSSQERATHKAELEKEYRGALASGIMGDLLKKSSPGAKLQIAMGNDEAAGTLLGRAVKKAKLTDVDTPLGNTVDLAAGLLPTMYFRDPTWMGLSAATRAARTGLHHAAARARLGPLAEPPPVNPLASILAPYSIGSLLGSRQR